MSRVVVTTDVPADQKDAAAKIDQDAGATVQITLQGDGLYTVTATYPNPVPGSGAGGGGSGQIGRVAMALEGIDLAEGQGAVEWHRIAQDGKSFAFIRGAYGDRADKMAVQNFLGAKSEGLLCGLYHFYRVTRDPDEQANLMVDILQRAQFGSGDLPPVIDVEDNPAYDGPWKTSDNGRFVDGIRKWLARMTAEFRCTPIIYVRASFWTQIGNPAGFNQYPLWVANYDVARPKIPSGWEDYAFWQYSEHGAVDGVGGSCDLNHFNGEDAALRALALP
jgi:lysozyme